MATPQKKPGSETDSSSAGGHYLIPHKHIANSIIGRTEPLYDAIDVYANNQLVALYNAATAKGATARTPVPAVTVVQAIQQVDGEDTSLGQAKAKEFLDAKKITQQEYDNLTKEIPPTGKGTPPSDVTIKGKDIAPFTGTDFQLNTLLTPNGTTLGMMINRVTYPRVPSQLSEGYPGMTPAQIVSNLANLAYNIYEPLKKQYPNVFMTNSFRHGATIGGGQHGTGQAADFQFRGVNSSAYYDIAVWMSKNLPYDQLLLEYLPGKTVWIHCSYATPGLPSGGISVSKSKPQNRLATLNGAKGGKFVPNLHADIIANAGINRVVAA